MHVHPALAQTDHRPWPLPSGPWRWHQAWLDLAFIHFEADPADLRGLIPAGLELELFDGKAWIGIVPFRMEGVTKRGWPAPSLLCDFPEINVRTYVTDGRKSGVWFFSLSVPHFAAVWFARKFFHLPYFNARIVTSDVGGGVHYAAQRGPHEFVAEYRPGPLAPSKPGSFSAWATERYCLYSRSADGRIFRGEIHHIKWPLQQATIDLRINTLSDYPLGPMHPEVLFSRRVDVVLWSLEQIN